MNTVRKIYIGIVVCGAGLAAHASPFTYTAFGPDISDVPHDARMENAVAGYAPFADAHMFNQIQLDLSNLDANMADELDADAAVEPQLSDDDVNAILDSAFNDISTNVAASPNDGALTWSLASDAANNSANNSGYMPEQISSGNPSGTTYCAARHPKISPGQRIPLGPPIDYSIMTDGTGGWPPSLADQVDNGKFCSPYAWRAQRNSAHMGVDIGCRKSHMNAPIFATAAGVVVTAKNSGGSAGKYVKIDHGNGFKTLYMHMNDFYVKKGDVVQAGCMIGRMGHTGGYYISPGRYSANGVVHVHYEMHYTGNDSTIRAPNGQTLKIIHGDGNPAHSGCQRGKHKFCKSINPTEFVKYRP